MRGIKTEVLEFVGPNGETFDDMEWHAWVREQLFGSGPTLGDKIDDIFGR